jgi:hypothetical protein
MPLALFSLFSSCKKENYKCIYYYYDSSNVLNPYFIIYDPILQKSNGFWKYNFMKNHIEFRYLESEQKIDSSSIKMGKYTLQKRIEIDRVINIGRNKYYDIKYIVLESNLSSHLIIFNEELGILEVLNISTKNYIMLRKHESINEEELRNLIEISLNNIPCSIQY